MNCSPASPYAAPQTPIASAKRPKIHLKARPTPKRDSTPENDVNGVEGSSTSNGIGNGSPSGNSSSSSSATSTPDLRRLTVRNNLYRSVGIIPCTPSKIMFSPGLRPKKDTISMPPLPVVDNSDRESVSSDWNNSGTLAADCSFSTTASAEAADHATPDEEIKQYSADDGMTADAENTVPSVTADDAGPAVDDIYSASLDSGEQQVTIAVDEDEEDVDVDDDETAFNPYAFIAQLPDPSLVARATSPHLPPHNKASPLTTLVLDLDETLVHCTVDPVEKADMVFPVEFNGTMYKVYGRKRPYLDYFLEQVSRSFEVVLFTASQRVYADILVDIIDPDRRLIKHRLFRESCLLVQGSYLKDLQVLGRDLKTTLLVDNSPYAFGYQVDNGVPIESWYDDDNDTELLKLLGFLKRIQSVDDVRPVIRGHFKTHELISSAALKLQQKESGSKKSKPPANR